MLKTFQCPSCGVRLQPDGSRATITCDYCGNTVVVPEELRERASAPNVSISISGVDTVFSRVDLPPATMREIVALLRDNQKINAIKAYREATGMGLKESKDAVENIERLLEASGAQNIEEFAAVFAQAAHASQTRATAAPEPTRVRLPRWATALIVFIIITSVVAGIIVPIIASIAAFAAPVIISRQIEEQNPATNISETIQAVIPTFAVPTEAPQPSPTPGYAALLASFGSEGIGAGQLKDARRISVDSDGRIYVGEYIGGRIQVFDPDGKFRSVIHIDPEMPLLGLAADRYGGLYVSQGGNLTRYMAATGAVDQEIAADPDLGRGFGSIALTQSGNIVAALRSAASPDDIVILSPEGEVLQTIRGAFSSQTGSPELDFSVAVDGLGNIYALGAFTVEVFKFSPEGRFLTRWGSRGDGKGQFRSVQDIAVDGQGRVYVCEVDRIQVFDSSGRLLGEIGRQETVMFGLAVTDTDEVLAAARTKVYRFRVNE